MGTTTRLNVQQRLELLRGRAQAIGFDLAWAPANQAWCIVDYRPHAPETAELRGIKNNLDDIEAFLEEKGG
jgi:hypothetical protein